jgi:hypothetical protein
MTISFGCEANGAGWIGPGLDLRRLGGDDTVLTDRP